MMDSRYLEPEIETADRATMRRLQEERLRAQVRHAYEHSLFYRRKFDAAGITPRDIESLEDLAKLPFTTKDELKADQAEHPPWGSVLAVPLSECLRIHFTSATTGRPVAVLDTPEDWYGFYHSYARSLYAFGVRQTDMVMAAFGYGPYIGFWSGFYAAQDLGCLLFPAGGYSTEQRLDILRNYPITVLGCTPSYALYLAETARRHGIDLARETQLRLTWHTGEPGAGIPSTKRKIEEAFGARVFDLPGLTEIAAWGFESAEEPGIYYIHEDYAYPEVLDLETGRPVGPGERGELVLTSLYRKAFPLLRYRTRDIVERAPDAPRKDGRTLFALKGGVIGRLDDMKKVRGVIVYPSRVEELVRQHPGVDEFRIIFRRVEGLDDLLVRLDPSPELTADDCRALVEDVGRALQLGLGIRTSVEVVAPGTLPRWDHKARRVEDQRTEVPF